MQLGLIKKNGFLEICFAEVEAAASGFGVHEKQAQDIADAVVARLISRYAGSSIYVGAKRVDVERFAEKVATLKAQGVAVCDIARRYGRTGSHIYQLLRSHKERAQSGPNQHMRNAQERQ